MFGQRIKELRSRKGVTQEAMAKALSVSPQAISKWEQNSTLPDISLLVPIADYFDVSVDSLLRTPKATNAIEPESLIEVHVEKSRKHWLCHIKNKSTYELSEIRVKALFHNANDEVIDYTERLIFSLEPGMSRSELLISPLDDHVDHVSIDIKDCSVACTNK